MVEIRKKCKMNGHLKWCCFEELVLKFGQEYESQPRPKKFKAGIPKQCFHNSAKLAIRRPDLVYVEGYGFMKNLGLPILHAWVVERGSNKAIDVIGIPFTTQYIRSRLKASSDTVSMLDDYRNDFPLLRMDESEISQVVDNLCCK
jgi:hypothetical protein